MARARTLTSLRDDVRARGDFVGDGNISDADLLLWINQGIAEYRDICITADPWFFHTSSSVSATAGTSAYALPATFVYALGVDVLINGRTFPIERMQPQERIGPNSPSFIGFYGVPFTRYDVRGSNLVFDPDPGTNTYTLHFSPTQTDLAAPADTFDGITGWEDYVVTFAVIRALDRQEQDSTPFRADLARLEARIKKMVGLRDASSAPRVADVRGFGRRRL